jgi:hypothetical protein
MAYLAALVRQVPALLHRSCTAGFKRAASSGNAAAWRSHSLTHSHVHSLTHSLTRRTAGNENAQHERWGMKLLQEHNS